MAWIFHTLSSMRFCDLISPANPLQFHLLKALYAIN